MSSMSKKFLNYDLSKNNKHTLFHSTDIFTYRHFTFILETDVLTYVEASGSDPYQIDADSCEIVCGVLPC